MPPIGAQNPIQALVAERGGMPFRDFMELALYHPEHGYYGAGRASVGRDGDFFTNVSVGRVYGELLAGQFVEMWERLGRPGDFAIVEQGANDGAFAVDVLGWCREHAPACYESARYGIVEGFEVLSARQAERLAAHKGKVRWHPSLEDLPPFTGVHFSNELVDAFPVHLVRWRAGGWQELWVTGDLEWRERPLPPGRLPERLADVPQLDGYTTEVNLEALRWAEILAGKIERGWVLTVDYGMPRDRYYAPERNTGTLQCYAAHTKGLNPLANPGHCDLTAHVEFTSLAQAFMAAGLNLAGYTDQHHFLTGLAARAFAHRAPTPHETRGLKTLLHPEMLGTSFQVLCLSRKVTTERLGGFQFARDGRRVLGVE
jgi:SAM-dependent MidA family methyltransferase